MHTGQFPKNHLTDWSTQSQQVVRYDWLAYGTGGTDECTDVYISVNYDWLSGFLFFETGSLVILITEWLAYGIVCLTGL